MPTINILYKREYPITPSISVVIPSVGEIIDAEDEYYSIVHCITAMPIDMMVELDDAGIDFTQIDAFGLFILLFEGLKQREQKYINLVFKDLDLSKFEIIENPETHSIILYDSENDIRIDRGIHNQIATVLRRIHNYKKDRRKPANKEAKEYMLERAHAKKRRNQNRKVESQLESLIVAMVNTEEFKYSFEGTRELSIYQFNESVHQIIKKVDYKNKMYGVYTGTIDAKGLSPDDVNWLIHK